MPAGEGRIQTVCGPIAPSQLGPALMHEHVFCDVTPPEIAAQGLPDVEITLENVWEIRHHWYRHTGNHRLEAENIAVAELARLREVGGAALVDVTCTGIKPNPHALRRVSAAAGVHIVAGCGYYVEPYLDAAIATQSVDRLAGAMIRDLREGIDGTDVRAGIIGEIGCSGRWTEIERRIMQAAVVAQQETGAALTIHPPRFPFSPLEIVAFVRDHGGDVSRTVIGHVDRTIFDRQALYRLADSGCVIEFDFFGIESSYYPFQEELDLPNDGARLDAIRDLVKRGHVGRVLMSHDICTKTQLVRYGGHGYAHILRNIVPAMKRKDFTDEELRTILQEWPRALLAVA